MLLSKPFRRFPFISSDFRFSIVICVTFTAIVVARSRSYSRSCSPGTVSLPKASLV